MNTQASQAQSGYGATFGVSNNGGASYQALAEVVSIQPPEKSRATIDVTHLQSPDQYEEFIKGLKSGGETSLTLNYLPTDAGILEGMLEDDSSDEPDSFEIVFPRGDYRLRFKAICTKWAPGGMSAGEKLTLSATFKVSGRPVLEQVD